MIRPSINAVPRPYNLVTKPEAEGLLFVQSHLTGERTSRFTHIHHHGRPGEQGLMQACWAGAVHVFQRCVAWTGSSPILGEL